MDLSAKDICLIMQKAARLGVTSLSMGDLDISFSNSRFGYESSNPELEKSVSPVDKNVVVEQQQVIQQQAERLEMVRQEEEKYANLPVQDPLAWEEVQSNIATAQGELEDAKDLHVQ